MSPNGPRKPGSGPLWGIRYQCPRCDWFVKVPYQGRAHKAFITLIRETNEVAGIWPCGCRGVDHLKIWSMDHVDDDPPPGTV